MFTTGTGSNGSFNYPAGGFPAIQDIKPPVLENVAKPEKKKHKIKKRIAHMQDPALEAIAEGLFRFEHITQAVSLLDRLGKQFVICKDQDPVSADTLPTLKLWIRGYNITDEEKAKGFRGHFAKLSIKKLDGNKITLIAEKLDIALRLHPQKERPKHRHPNWGHPILRAAERAKIYPAVELVRQELLRLHEEFPETSIPGRDKLHMMVYSRQANPPIKKVTIRIQPVGEQGFKLEVSDNIRKQETIAALAGVAPSAGSATVPEGVDSGAVAAGGGKFATMVALSRKKKKPAPRKKATEEK